MGQEINIDTNKEIIWLVDLSKNKDVKEFIFNWYWLEVINDCILVFYKIK